MPGKGDIRVTVAGATDVGQVREHNEDNLLVADLTTGERAGSGDSISSRELGERGLLVAVADGMGGAASGELASEMAVDTVHESAAAMEFGEATIEDVARGLAECLRTANEKIFLKSQAESEHRGMGTTMTAVHALGENIAIGQVGDSRAYLLRKGKLVQVTKDQSLISQLIEEGTLTEEEAERLGGRNIILQALGVEGSVTVETKTMEVLDGDVLALCSDGLSGMVKDEEIESVLNETEDLGVACGRLITRANEAGGRDNITVILVRFEGKGLRSPMKPLEAEEGGTGAPAFVPPEIPEPKPARQKPLFLGLGLLVLAAVAFFLLSGGSGELVLGFPADGVSGELRPVGEEGAPIPFEAGKGERSYSVPDLAPGKWTLVARHPDYRSLEIEITVRSGRNPLDVKMIPLPGTVTVRSVLPRVSVLLEHRDDAGHVNMRKEFKLEGNDPVVLEKVPAGSLSFTVSRKTFQTRTVAGDLPPNGTLAVVLPALDPVLGTIKVACPVAGFHVDITDDWGEDVWSGDTSDSGPLTARVRVGEHTLTATHPDYETFRDKVTILEGEEWTVRIPAEGKRGSIVVRGPPGARVFVTRAGGGSGEWRNKIPETGEVTFPRIPPGDYDVRLEQAGKPGDRRSARVDAARQATVEFPR